MNREYHDELRPLVEDLHTNHNEYGSLGEDLNITINLVI
jgi:hypothetical protein